MALDRDAEGIFDEGALPSVYVGLFGGEDYVVRFGERGGLGDGYGFCGAGLHAFAGEAIGGGEAPGAAGDYADAYA